MSPREHEYWVYIMASHSGTLYIGITGDIFTRVMQHKAGETEASHATTNAIGWFITRASVM
jgi:predicted GIY-YIG superfamily endonuclease